MWTRWSLPYRRGAAAGESFYLQAEQEIADSAWRTISRVIIFTSSTSVYGDIDGTAKKTLSAVR